jgi:hypothetical protein
MSEEAVEKRLSARLHAEGSHRWKPQARDRSAGRSGLCWAFKVKFARETTDLFGSRDLLDEERLEFEPLVSDLYGIRVGTVDAFNVIALDKYKSANAAEQLWQLGIL